MFKCVQTACRWSDDRLFSKDAIISKLLTNTAAPTNSSKRSRPSARQRFIPRPRNKTESCFLADALWNAYHRDAAALTRRQVLLAEKSTIRTIQPRSAAESCFMAAQRGLDMVLVRGIPIEHFILGDQTLRAFGEEDFVTEFDWCSHLAAHDQIGMRLEDGINLLGNLL